MIQMKIFKTTNNSILTTMDIANRWIENNNIKVHQISLSTGASYTAKDSSYVVEVEMFIVVSYFKEN